MIEFWRGTLNTNAQRCYNSILGRLQRGATEIQCGGIQSDDVFSAYTAITKDHPELFYLPSQSETSTQTLTARGFKKEDTTLIISNIYSPSDVSKCQNHIKTIINDLKKHPDFPAAGSHLRLLMPYDTPSTKISALPPV